MKPYCLLITFLLIAHLLHGQSLNDDTSKRSNSGKVFTSVETIPQFPGGFPAFSSYISRNVKYPDIARLIGINGKVIVAFTVNENGKIVDAAPINCIGAGCEAEAVKVLEMSPTWRPGIQNSRPVRVRFSVPISFIIPKGKVTMKALRNSGYGFVFNIKGNLYTFDEAEVIIGSSFLPEQVEIAEPFFNYNKAEKFEMRDKKEVYLIVMKSK